jgi:hypothetical protein
MASQEHPSGAEGERQAGHPAREMERTARDMDRRTDELEGDIDDARSRWQNAQRKLDMPDPSPSGPPRSPPAQPGGGEAGDPIAREERGEGPSEEDDS